MVRIAPYLYFVCQAKEAVGLVRAAADHEKLRQEHFRQVKALTKKLEKLEKAAKR